MRKLLIQLDSDRLPSSFDRVVGYDAGADDVLSYGGVGAENVEALVHGAIFTRGPKQLKNTAIFLGGSDMRAGEGLLARARESFFGPFKVSLMLDSNGSNTTAVAAVIKLERASGGVEGKNVLVLGTGPVGVRAAGLFALAEGKVTVVSRNRETAQRCKAEIEERFQCSISSKTANYPLKAGSIDDADILLAAGPPAVRLVEGEAWAKGGGPTVLGDVNAVPPLGIEGVDVSDDGAEKDGATVFGALGIGGLKMKVHKACIARLFESNDLILDAETIYEAAQSL